MDTLWSQEFGIALTVFVAPMALAAGLVYRRIQKLALRRKSARRTLKADYVRRLLEVASRLSNEALKYAGCIDL